MTHQDKAAPPREDGRDRLAWLAKHATRSGVRDLLDLDPDDWLTEVDRLMDEEGTR